MKPILKIKPTESSESLDRLIELAWEVRERSHIVGKTKVGCAAMSEDGEIFAGCNVEHIFRCHDVHAEVNAITSMVAGGATIGQIELGGICRRPCSRSAKPRA